MFGAKSARIAELEARNAHLLRELKAARGRDTTTPGPGDAVTVAQVRAELRQLKKALRQTEDQLGQARRENAARTIKQVEYSNRAVANMRRLRRAVRACARYRAELAQQQQAMDRRSVQLFDSLGYDAAARDMLGLPAAGVTS